MKNKYKFIVGVLLLLNVGCAKQEELTVMTDQELILMQRYYGAKGVKISQDEPLSDGQKRQLDLIRKGQSILEERYHESDIIIREFQSESRYSNQHKYILADQENNEYIGTLIESENGDIWSDNYYGTVIGKEFDAKVKEVFADAGYEVSARTSFTSTMADEWLSVDTLDDFLAIENNNRYTYVFLKQTEANNLFVLDSIEERLREEKLTSIYSIYSVPEDEYDNTFEMINKRKQYEVLKVINFYE